MKPRTKLQFRVVGLSSQLPDIKSMITEWANNDCLDHIGYATCLLYTSDAADD